MNEADPLLAGANRPADEGLEGRDHLLERAAVGAEDDAEARMDHANPAALAGSAAASHSSHMVASTSVP